MSIRCYSRVILHRQQNSHAGDTFSSSDEVLRRSCTFSGRCTQTLDTLKKPFRLMFLLSLTNRRRLGIVSGQLILLSTSGKEGPSLTASVCDTICPVQALTASNGCQARRPRSWCCCRARNTGSCVAASKALDCICWGGLGMSVSPRSFAASALKEGAR
jgi:hypothetical protein